MSIIRRPLLITALFAAAGLFYVLGCGENTFIDAGRENRPPTIRLTSGPPEGDTTSYRIKFSWIGNDPDGRVDHYEYAICDGAPLGFDPADTTGLDKWKKTFRTDSLFRFSTTEFDQDLNVITAYYKKVHTFFVRAVDNSGARSAAAFRSFTARNISPYVIIDLPRNLSPGQIQSLPSVIRFRWTGYDPTDVPWQTQDVDSVRCLLVQFKTTTLNDLNKNTASFDKLWRPWIAYNAPGDSGVSTVIGDDEFLNTGSSYLFVVQAKDEAGAVTPLFSTSYNVRYFRITASTGPLLKVREPYLGTYTFLGTTTPPESFIIPANFDVNFQWKADASSYGGEVSSYRYGWDVVEPNDPSSWDVLAGPDIISAPPKRFRSGIHTLLIEATDNVGGTTIAQIEIEAVPLDMSRNLLWVDDFFSTDFMQTGYGMPTESEHTAFWTNICQKAKGFDPMEDIYITGESSVPPPMQLLWKYKNIIWTYSSRDDVNAWDDMVRFIPESMIGRQSRRNFNYLAYYLASGGHVWTEGMSDDQGGLCAVILPSAQFYPINLRCEITGPQTGCTGDTSGVFTMAYRDYCVTVIDKVLPRTRSGANSLRNIDWDGMTYAYRDDRDPVTALHPRLPKSLTLWDEVTKAGRFFDPAVRGFYYVELYNPAYWMSVNKIGQQSCFHPMFRMKARLSSSVVNNACVAFWTMKYDDVVANAPGTVAAPSVHFGLPLWFFNRAQVDSIANVVFGAWQIRAQP